MHTSGGASPQEEPTAIRNLRDAFLEGLSPHTARAYNADLTHLGGWLKQSDHSLADLTDLLLFRYLCQLIEAGYSANTVRRRLTCVRSFKTAAASRGLYLQLDTNAVAERLRDLEGNELSTTSVLIASDDAIALGGLRSAARAAGLSDISCMTVREASAGMDGLPSYDYTLVHVWPSDLGLDRLRAIQTVSRSASQAMTTTTIAINSFAPSPLVVLRQAEAGFRFAVPYARIREDPADFFVALRRGDTPPQYALPSQWALRQELNLRWSGEIEPFLRVASQLPPQAWTTHRPQNQYAIGRAPFRAVQRAARDIAGLPEPSFLRYANSLRNPPELPEWSRVRSFVRQLWAQPGD